MPNFRPTDRLTGFLMPPLVDEWLPEKHLARFVVEVVDDGVGGAVLSSGGTGLLGLIDRVEALGGEFVFSSPAEGGTAQSIDSLAGDLRGLQPS